MGATVRCFWLSCYGGEVYDDPAAGIDAQPLPCTDVGELDGFGVVAAAVPQPYLRIGLSGLREDEGRKQ